MENSWKKIAVKTLLVLGLTLLILFTAGMLVGAFFGDKIKELAIKELNKRLATEVSVKGTIDFSVFSNFPYASITFNSVELKETLPEKNNLLTCEKISLLFNIWDVFGSNYSMEKVIAENGQLFVRINKEGKNNYDIFKSPEGGGTGKEFSMKIDEAELSNILIQYDDERSNQHYLFDTRASSLSGDFSADNFILKIQSDLVSKKLSLAGIDYLPNHAVIVDGTLEVHLSDNRFDIKDGIIQVENNSFSISGNVQPHAEGNKLDLKVAGTELRIEELAALLPREYASYISHFKSEGTIQFNGTIKGMTSATTKPHVNIEFGVKNGTLSHEQMKESFKEVNMQGVFSNGASNSLSTSYFDLRSFSTSFDGNTVRGTVLLRNFKQPYLDVKLDGEVTLQKIRPLFPSDYIKELEGIVNFRGFYFKGGVDHLTSSSQLNKIEAGGSFHLKEVTIGTDRTSYNHLNGIFDITNNQIIINQLSFNANKSDLSFTGYINNFIPYLLTSLSDSVKNNQKIGLNIQLTSKSLSWVDLVGTSDNNTASKPKVAGNYSIPSLFYIVTGSVSGAIDKFSYDKFNASAVRGKILFLGNTIYFNDFGLNAEKGSVTANGKLDISNIKLNKLDLTAKLDKMDITQLFYEFNNFDQTTLTDKHLKGEISSELALQATWDERKFNKSKLYAVANVTVDNGELNNFEPMMALAKFVKITDLKNIRFSKLENQVEIKNQKVYIPQMQILTNALNLRLSGIHSFENIIDYKIQLNLLRLLTSKFEKSSGNPDEFEKSTEGFLNLYLTMTGPASNPVIKYDKRAVKEKISADLKHEKTELKDVLKKEFDLQQRDQQEIRDWKAPEEIEYMEFEEDTIEASLQDDENKTNLTKENQKKELDNFKNIFKPKSPAPR